MNIELPNAGGIGDDWHGIGWAGELAGSFGRQFEQSRWQGGAEGARLCYSTRRIEREERGRGGPLYVKSLDRVVNKLRWIPAANSFLVSVLADLRSLLAQIGDTTYSSSIFWAKATTDPTQTWSLNPVRLGIILGFRPRISTLQELGDISRRSLQVIFSTQKLQWHLVDPLPSSTTTFTFTVYRRTSWKFVRVGYAFMAVPTPTIENKLPQHHHIKSKGATT